MTVLGRRLARTLSLAAALLWLGLACGRPLAQGGEMVQLVIGPLPADRTGIHRQMAEVPGAVLLASLAATRSEVWDVPEAAVPEITRRLASSSLLVINIATDNSHLQREGSARLRLTPQQLAVVVSLSRIPAVVANQPAPPPPVPSGGLGTPVAADPRQQAQTFGRAFLPLTDGTHVELRQVRQTIAADGAFTWFGEVAGSGERALLMLWGDGHLSGFFGFRGKVYTIEHAGDRIRAVAEIDPAELPRDHVTGDESRRLVARPAEPEVVPFDEAERRRLEAKPITIDLMMLYSRGVAGRYIIGNRLLALAIEAMNDSFRNSGLGNISVRLVHTEAVDYDEGAAEPFDHLYSMVDGIGPFKDVKRLRDEKRADIVGLIVHSPVGCGLSTRVGADAEEAFFIVHHACAGITYSIAHEIGHILGARHDRQFDTGNALAPFAHGYVNGSKWRTMMSYQAGCGGCPRIPYWSNPRILYQGEPTGTPATDNARVILEQAARVAAFR